MLTPLTLPLVPPPPQTLRRLYQLTFFQASATPIPDLIHYLLQLPCPASTGTKVSCSTARKSCGAASAL